MATLTDNGDGTVSLTFKQGATEAFHIDVYTDESNTVLADLTGYSARGMGRQKYGSISAYPSKFSISCAVSGGRVSCVILPSDSDSCDTTSGVYDIEIYNPDDEDVVYRIQQGAWTMDQGVTV